MIRSLIISVFLLIPAHLWSQTFEEAHGTIETLMDAKDYDNARSLSRKYGGSNDLDIQAWGKMNMMRLMIKQRRDLDSIPLIFEPIWVSIEDREDSIFIYLKARLAEVRGHYHYLKGDIPMAINWLKHSNTFYSRSGHHSRQAYNLNMMGTIMQLTGKDDAALEYYLDAQKIHQLYPTDSSDYINLMIDLAAAYQGLGRDQKSITINRGILAWPKKYLTPTIKAHAYNNMGMGFLKMEKIPDAENYFLSALQVYDSIPERDREKAVVLNNLATLYQYNLKNPALAERFYKYSIQLKSAANDPYGMAKTYANLASLKLERNQPDSAIYYGQRSLEMSKNVKDLSNLESTYEVLGKAYLQKKNYKKALEYLLLEKEIQDSLYQNAISHRVSVLEQQYERDRQEAEITLLKKENEIKDLRLTQSKKLGWVFGALALLSFISLGLVVFTFRNRQRTRSIIHEKDLQLASVTNLVKGQEEERNRLARELHDSLGNILALLQNKIIQKTDSDKELTAMVQEAAAELHAITHDLMPGVLLKFGLKDALEDLVRRWQQDPNLTIDLNIGKIQLSPDDPRALILYRVMQELLKNAIEKGKATYILIELFESNEWITLNFEDNGIGFDPKNPGKGLGLKNIENRVAFMGGKLMMDSGNFGSSFKILIPKK
ncbi:MAG: tetratricopeptide repeat protein [Bacteroidota bacterium]|nr:tetratricopeptide repeat protein [Bacteroidota bacterium]MDX5446915.1 tetratricopeptide repeat protein [Bacteroidota bacterium]MDX5505157.1 tetratricopeptide repeat protein [Bacteroidota bacterium]